MIEACRAGAHMKRVSSSIGALIMAFALVASASAAERTRKKAEEVPPPPPQFRVDVATRSMSVTKLLIQVPVGFTVGKYCYDLFCGESQQILSDYAFRGVPHSEFGNQFMEEAQAAGYKLPTASSDLFQSGDTVQAELQVGAVIAEFTAKGRREEMIVTQNYSLDATMAVEWQVFDPLEKKILFRGSSRGAARVSNREGAQTLPRDAARAAFREASKAILMHPEFLAAVKDPRGGQAPQAGVLFEEASPSTPPAPFQITRLPLHTRTFQEQVADLRAQVVTVITGSGTGSAFYIADGLLLTNHHVISGHTRVKIRFFGGREIDGDVVNSNAKRDIALLRTEKVGLPGLPLQLDKPEITSPTFVIGSPLGEKNEGSISTGIVSGFRDNEAGPMIQSDVGITHGNSGGPMFDAKGNVTGVAVQSLRDNYGTPTPVRYFIPIDDALKSLGLEIAPAPNVVGR